MGQDAALTNGELVEPRPSTARTDYFSSRPFLDVVSQIYFDGRPLSMEDVRVGDDVLRLLVVDGKHVLTSAPFLDYHQPLYGHQRPVERSARYARFVVRGIVPVEQWQSDPAFHYAPFVNWSRFPAFADYESFILNRDRKEVRQNERRLRRLTETFGEPLFTIDDQGEDVLTFTFHWKALRLRQAGLRNLFESERNVAFFSLLRERGLLRSSTLRVGGRLVASSLGFVHEDVWSGWICTFDPDLQKYSLGHQLLKHMLKKSHESGHREFDFSLGAFDYKMVYATHLRILGSIGRLPLRYHVAAEIKKHPTLFRAAKSFKMQIAASPL